MNKRILIASLVVALSLTACANETTESAEPVIETTIQTEAIETVEQVEVVEIVEPTEVIETIEVTEQTEPIIELVVETEPVETEPVETVDVVDVVDVVEDVETIYLGQFLLTAYCPCSKCCGEYANGITATGTTATAGRTIAVDPSVIPYGSEVIINDHTYVAEDCGGSIDGNRIDIFFNDHGEAWNFGMQYADVYLVRS